MAVEEPPRQIGRYQILAEIGRGGFGRVYRAYDPTVGRSVAVKVLTDGGRDLLTRFRNEAMVAGNLRHENIVTVYEYGEHAGRPFLAMEYLEGEDLQSIISSRKPLTLLQKCDIMSQVAEGLYCAHRNQVVHRDVKPANIMVLPDGTVKIMDFGIARLTDGEATRLTQQGSMVGTLLYMAPEQLSGADVDELCDIFAYGVIYYELVTGKHPFESSDARVLMYKISFEDPPPIRSFVPDIPDALQRVISRILQKDRELRYQTLKEVQFDTEPIRIELQHQQATSLIVRAQELFQAQQLEPALNVLLEVLSLDPANREARSFYERVQKEVQYRTLQPRIEALCKAGAEHLAKKRFADAVQSFEAALRLDRDNAQIQAQAARARELLERNKQAARLVVEARRHFDAHDFSSAYRVVSEALIQEAENQNALELRELVRDVIERRQQEQRVTDAIQRAEGLLLLRAYDEARSILTALGPDASSPRVQKTLVSIQEQEEQQERRERLRRDMITASDHLRERRLRDAVQCLERLAGEFPGEPEVTRLLLYAQNELAAQTRAEQIEKTVRDAGALIQSHEFDAALALIDQALKRYPGEGALIRLLSSAMGSKSEWQRQQAICAARDECAALRSQRRYAEAILSAEAAVRDYGNEPSLVSLLQDIRKEREGYELAEAVRIAVQTAEGLLDRRQPERAVRMLQQALAQNPREASLEELLRRAQEEVRAQEKARSVEAIQREAESRAGRRDYSGALTILDQGLEAWKDEASLISQREAISAAKAAGERQQAIDEVLQRASRLRADTQFSEALDLIQASLSDYPDEAALLSLRDQIAREADQHKRRQALREVVRKTRLLVGEERLDDAAAILKQGLRDYPGEGELQTLTAEVQQKIQARERALAIQKCIQECKTLVSLQDFDGARRLIENGLATYAGDLAMLRQLESVRDAQSAWQRKQAIEDGVRQAAVLSKAHDFDDALRLVVTLLREYQNEPALVEAQQRIEAESQQHRRQEAIRGCVSEIAALLDQGEIGSAARVLNDASERYPGEREWEPLLARVKQEMQERQRAAERRAEAVSRAADAARALIGQGRAADALELLRDAAAEFPGEASLKSALAEAEAEIDTLNRKAQVIGEAEGLLREGQFEPVIERLQPMLARFPGDPAITELLSAAKEKLEFRKRDEAIEKLVEDARALALKQNFDGALALAGRGLETWPSEQRILAIQKSIESQKAALERERALQKALEAIRDLGERQRFGEGLKKIDAALQNYPEAPALAELRQDFRTRQALRDAGDLVAKGQPEDALRLLEQSVPERLLEPAVSAMMSRAREQLLAQKRAAVIAQRLRDANARIEAGDFDGALGILEAALIENPGARELEDAVRAAQERKAEREKRDAISDVLRQCELLERQGRFLPALEAVRASLKIFPADPELLRVEQRLDIAWQNEEKRVRRERDLEEMRFLADRCREAFDLSQLKPFRDAADHVSKQYGAGDEAASMAARLVQLLDAIGQAQAKLVQRDYPAVLQICDRHSGASLAFEALKREAEQGQKFKYMEDLRLRAEAEQDLAARSRLFEEALRRYPNEQRLSEELRLLKNKLSLVQSIVDKAKSHEASGNWDEALEQWKNLSTIYRHYPGLEAETQRAREGREKKRAQEIARWVARIEPPLKNGDLQKAAELLRQAQTELSDASEIQDLVRRLERAQETEKRVRELVSEAREALKTDWRRSDLLTQEVLRLDPARKIPDALVQGIARQRKESEIVDSISRAEQLRGSGDLRAALAEIEQILVKYSGEPRLESVREAVALQIRREREALLLELRSILDIAQSLDSLGEVEAHLNRLGAIAARIGGDPELRVLYDEAGLHLNTRKRALRAERFREALRSRGKWVAGLAAALLLAAFGWVAARQWSRTHQIVQIIIKSADGVTVSVGNKTCVTPHCTFDLAPGTYRLMAAKDGYAEITQSFAVSARQSTLEVPLAMEPLPQILQVNTNFDSGRVFVDGQLIGELHDGQLSNSGLAPGRHSVVVRGGGAEFEARWRSVAGVSPELEGAVSAKDVQAAVVTNAGPTGSIACNCGIEPILVDGMPAGETTAAAASPLKNLHVGTRRVSIGGHPLVVDIRPNPTINVFLTLDRNVGTLVVDAGQDNVRIRLNNRIYPRTTEHGILRIPLPVGSYAIRAEKEGFRASDTQSVDVVKGEEKQVTLGLSPLPSILEITAALPGAQVKVDGRSVGETGASGTFRTELQAGTHVIELSKEGYSTARLEAQLRPGNTSRPSPGQIAMMKIVTAPPPPDARQIEAQDWERVRNSTNTAELDDFLRKHPGGAHVEEARARLTQLNQQAEANAARQAELAAWNAVDKNNKVALQNFVSRYGNGPHSAEARTLVAGIEKQEADALAAALKTKEQKEKEQEQANRAAADERAISAALSNYESAYNRMDLKSLQIVWSGMPKDSADKIGAEFRLAKSIAFRLQPIDRPVVNGDSATVNCSRTTSLTPKGGKPLAPSADRVHVVLNRDGSGWVIRSMMPY